MNIVILSPFGLWPKSTVRRRAFPLAQALAERGCRVSVIIPPWDWPADAGRRWCENGVKIQCLSLPSSVPGLFSTVLLARLLRAALNARPDVIHCLKPKGYAGLAAFLLWYGREVGLWRGRLVVDSDDWEGHRGWNERGGYSWAQRQFFAWQERWGLLHADAVTVASHTLQTLARNLGVPLQRICYLPNGIPPWPLVHGRRRVVRRRYGIDDCPVILGYTRFVGCEPARWAAIVAGVAARSPLAHFLIVGAGLAGEEKEFYAHIQAQGLAGRVTLTGWVPEEELPSYFAAADLALFPLDDTLINRARCPAKLVDLLAAGVPVLAEAVGEAKTYIEDGVSGVLLPPGSQPTKWGAEASALLNDGPRRRGLGRAAQQRMQEKFAWDRLVEGLLALYS